MSAEAAEEAQDLAVGSEEGAAAAGGRSSAPIIVIRNSIAPTPAPSNAGVAPYKKQGASGFNPCCCFSACCGLKVICIVVAVFEIILAVPWFWAHTHILVLKSGLNLSEPGFNFSKHDHFKTVVDKDLGYFGKIGVGLRDVIGDDNTAQVIHEFESTRRWGALTGGLLVVSAIIVLACIIFGLVTSILKIKSQGMISMIPRIGAYVGTGFVVLHVLSMILTIVFLAMLCLKIEDYYDEYQATLPKTRGGGILDGWTDDGGNFEDGGPNLKTSATKFDEVRDTRIIVYSAMGMIGLLDTTVCLYIGVCVFALSGAFKSQ